jgi:hypothetical protein
MRELTRFLMSRLEIMEAVGDINPEGRRLLAWLRRRYAN